MTLNLFTSMYVLYITWSRQHRVWMKCHKLLQTCWMSKRYFCFSLSIKKENIIFKTVEYFHNIVSSKTWNAFVFPDMKINCISFLSNHELVNILRIFNRCLYSAEVVEVEFHCLYLFSITFKSSECMHSAFIALVGIQWISNFSGFLRCFLGPFGRSS